MNSKMAFWTFLGLLFLMVPAVAETLIAGTSVFIEPLAGYRAAESYTGLESEDDTWWLMVMEVPVPIAMDELLARMTDSAMAEKGIAVKRREQFETQLGPSTLLIVEQEQDGVTYEKLVLIVGDEKRAVSVTVGYLLESSDELRETMLASLRTVRLAEETAESSWKR